MRQKLGQHFLINPEVPEVIVAALEPTAGDTIIEVGPGHGELTQAIVSAIKASGADNVRIIAVERDPALAEEVRQRFKEYSFLEVVEADILQFLKDPEAGATTKNGYKLVGNIPYYLTGHLLRVVGERETQPARTILMIQKEVAERIAAEPPRMNRLAASVQFWAKPQILIDVPKEDFNPPPEVESALILLSAKEKPVTDKEVYYALVRKLFAQPRKTIMNNLAGKNSDDKNKALAILEKLSVSPDSRPQDLSVIQIAKISESY